MLLTNIAIHHKNCNIITKFSPYYVGDLLTTPYSHLQSTVSKFEAIRFIKSNGEPDYVHLCETIEPCNVFRYSS